MVDTRTPEEKADDAFFESKLSSTELPLLFAVQARGDKGFRAHKATGAGNNFTRLQRQCRDNEIIVAVRWRWTKDTERVTELYNTAGSSSQKLYDQGLRWGIEGDITPVTTPDAWAKLFQQNPYTYAELRIKRV